MATTINNTTANARLTIIFDAGVNSSSVNDGPKSGTGNTESDVYIDNKVYDKKSINKAFEQRFGKPKTSKPSKPSKPNTVEGSNITYNIERPSLKSQGMSTPLTPKMNPKNPRGHESITLKGGRKKTKPGTPGHSRGLGGKKTYSAKDPLWPEKIDRVLYPKNWM